MKKFLMTLLVAVFAVGAMSAQATKAPVKAKQETVQKKHECKDHKDGQACNKPADQQCPDCKAKAAAAQKQECKEGKQCDKAAGMKDCCKDKKMEGKKCDKAAGMKHECKEGKQCDKAAGMKHECKEGKQCDKAAGMKDCCKDKKMEGKKCDKPADQQCPDCKEKAKKN